PWPSGMAWRSDRFLSPIASGKTRETGRPHARSIMPSRETSTMSSQWNRREWLLAGAASWLGVSSGKGLRAPGQGGAQEGLVFTKSSGFQHSVITRKDGQLSLAERILTEIGKPLGFEVVASKDGRLFEPDKIGEWDAFVFETTGDLTRSNTDKQPPMSPDGEKAFYDAIRGGKGFLGIHCAADTFAPSVPNAICPGPRHKAPH